ncbi:MAG: hypothetical protein K0S76_900 [Herbinix sp.]|jgi:hypothetical protein|nr:hypothetical protein [Herbinix sp.]
MRWSLSVTYTIYFRDTGIHIFRLVFNYNVTMLDTKKEASGMNIFHSQNASSFFLISYI